MLTIRKGGHVDLERLYSAMEIDFDRKELLGKWSIHKALSAGDQELLVFSDGEYTYIVKIGQTDTRWS